MFRLHSCVWEITLACCFSCKYCGSKAGRARQNELSTRECIDLAGQLAELGCRRVSLIGGEVFMRNDWREIVAALSERGIKVNIITNGFIFSDKYINDLLSLKIESVSVSIDGPESIHDKYRQPGSFDRAIAAVRALSSGNIPVSVISTINRENTEKLEELYEILKQEKIFAWQLQACSPMGNAIEGQGIDYRFDFMKIISFVRAHRKNAPFAVGIADNIGYFTEDEPWLRGGGGYGFQGCGAGLNTIGIDSIGNIRGCESMYDERFIEGNIRERSLRSIWEDENAFSYNRKFTPEKLTGKCKGCSEAEYCAGGCRSYNYFVHGNIFESPFCVK